LCQMWTAMAVGYHLMRYQTSTISFGTWLSGGAPAAVARRATTSGVSSSNMAVKQEEGAQDEHIVSPMDLISRNPCPGKKEDNPSFVVAKAVLGRSSIHEYGLFVGKEDVHLDTKKAFTYLSAVVVSRAEARQYKKNGAWLIDTGRRQACTSQKRKRLTDMPRAHAVCWPYHVVAEIAKTACVHGGNFINSCVGSGKSANTRWGDCLEKGVLKLGAIVHFPLHPISSWFPAGTELTTDQYTVSQAGEVLDQLSSESEGEGEDDDDDDDDTADHLCWNGPLPNGCPQPNWDAWEAWLYTCEGAEPPVDSCNSFEKWEDKDAWDMVCCGDGPNVKPHPSKNREHPMYFLYHCWPAWVKAVPRTTQIWVPRNHQRAQRNRGGG